MKDLKILNCGGNQLTNLDLSHCSSIGQGWVSSVSCIDCYLDISNMPSLTGVCVWTMPFPSEGFRLCTEGSPNIYFTTDCSE